MRRAAYDFQVATPTPHAAATLGTCLTIPSTRKCIAL
jgi:hypothetical protein